ncbi:MAG: dipeptide epimerase [Rhodospirillales bacterium]|nr:dipeptide epimerase [Rhodospirillales bacterium]
MNIHNVSSLKVARENYPIRGAFAISRGSKREAAVVVAELIATSPDGRTVRGRGECVPYARYGETVEGVVAAIEAQAAAIAGGMDRLQLQSAMRAGAARNALDCAFWDMEAKVTGLPAWKLAGLSQAPRRVATAFTLSLGTPAAMGQAAAQAAAMPLLKLKLGGGDADDIERVTEVRRNAPKSRLIVDANEGWTLEQLAALGPELARLGVALIEQPLPAGQDAALAGFPFPVPLGADESCHGIASLPDLQGRYRILNIKLDKTGGLTGALALKAAAQTRGFGIMVGCMVATSLSMAPAFLLAQGADFVDLDGPLLLERDRSPCIAYDGAWMQPPASAIWG